MTNHHRGPSVNAPLRPDSSAIASAINPTPVLTAQPRRSSHRLPLPEAHADVALGDLKDVCALVRMSPSWVHEAVRAGNFPQPLRFGPRCTRWTIASIRAWLIDRAAQPQAEAAKLGFEKAKKASTAAHLKRAATVAAHGTTR